MVGKGISNNLKALSTIFDALAEAKVPVLLTNRCMAENNAIVGVHEKDFEEGIRAIYAAFAG